VNAKPITFRHSNKNRSSTVMSSFSKNSVFKMFSVHTNTKIRAILHCSGFKGVLEKLRFREGRICVDGTNCKNTAAFSHRRCVDGALKTAYTMYIITPSTLYSPNSDLQILLCLTPDDFTPQRVTLQGLRTKFVRITN